MSKPKTRLGWRSNRHMRCSLGFVWRLAPPTGGLMATTRGLQGEKDEYSCLLIFFSPNKKKTLLQAEKQRENGRHAECVLSLQGDSLAFSARIQHTSIAHNPRLFKEGPSTLMDHWYGIYNGDIFGWKKINGNVTCCGTFQHILKLVWLSKMIFDPEKTLSQKCYFRSSLIS